MSEVPLYTGTEFMQRLSHFLRYYIHRRCSTDPGWANVKVRLYLAQCID